MTAIERIKKIFEKYVITCPEDIWQTDRVTTNALSILQEIGEVIYKDWKDEK